MQKNKFIIPLEDENRSHLTTEEASHHLMRKPQTLRVWATYEIGPIKPIRINGRLAWSVNDIKKILNIL